VVGTVATALELAVLAAVLLMCVMSVRMWHHNPFFPIIPPHKPIFQVFGVGFALGLWLYAGYEQVSSVAEEVENPQRNYPKALAWVVPLSIATYFFRLRVHSRRSETGSSGAPDIFRKPPNLSAVQCSVSSSP